MALKDMLDEEWIDAPLPFQSTCGVTAMYISDARWNRTVVDQGRVVVTWGL